MEELTFLVEEEDTRIDIFLTRELSGFSRSSVQTMIEENRIFVNGKNIKSNYKVKAGNIITVYSKEPENIKIEPENIMLDVLYEDNDLIVINKPQNMVVHPAPGHYTQTLVNALLYHCKGSLSGINGEIRPGIVHRIDKDTSGVLVAAKNDFSHRGLSGQLENHSMTRKYEAVVFNNVKEETGTVDKPIGRSVNDRKKMSINEKNGRNAVTHYRVLERFRKFTHIEAKLETGRTHQIRVHMASIGHPLLGDSVYGSGRSQFNLEGQVLHAKVLGFVHPGTQKYMEFESALPDYFVKILQVLRSDMI